MRKFLISLVFILMLSTVTFSYSWKYTNKGWTVSDEKGEVIKNTWYCDNALGVADWYLIDADGYLVTSPLVSSTDKKGKKHYYFLSQDTKSLGKMLVVNGQYGKFYISFNNVNDAYYGEINLNSEGIKELVKEYGVKAYDSISSTYVYAKNLVSNAPSNLKVSSGGGGGGGGQSQHTHNWSWEIIKEATDTERGVKRGICTICGYEKYVYGDLSDDIDEDATRDEIDNYIDDKTANYTYYIAIDKFVTGADSFIVAPYKLQSNYQMTAAQALKKVADIKGFSLVTNNSFTNGWYLNKIKMGNIGPTTIYKEDIPECLRPYVTSSALTKRSATNLLGGSDYTTTSGWMYMVNGEHGNVSMGAYNLEDQDVLRLCFSLYGWGADVGSPWGSYYDFAFLTDEIRSVANGIMSLSTLVDKAKKLIEED